MSNRIASYLDNIDVSPCQEQCEVAAYRLALAAALEAENREILVQNQAWAMAAERKERKWKDLRAGAFRCWLGSLICLVAVVAIVVMGSM